MHFTKIIFSTLLLLVFLFACNKNASNCEPEAKPDCFHTLEFSPVCGCDGVTYSNIGHAACNSIDETTPGQCSILGEYRFLGFNTDGAKAGLNEQKYTGDPMTITLKEDADNDVFFPFEGKGQPNIFSGQYHIERKEYNVKLSTQAAGSEIENRYLQWLPRVISTKKDGDYLVMETNNDLGLALIFIKM